MLRFPSSLPLWLPSLLWDQILNIPAGWSKNESLDFTFELVYPLAVFLCYLTIDVVGVTMKIIIQLERLLLALHYSARLWWKFMFWFNFVYGLMLLMACVDIMRNCIVYLLLCFYLPWQIWMLAILSSFGVHITLNLIDIFLDLWVRLTTS